MWCPKRRRTDSFEDGKESKMPALEPSGDEPAIKIRVGSRKSKLALIQTEVVISELRKFYSEKDYQFELITMTTKGDHILDTPLSQIGSKSLFTKELEDGLLNKSIDFVVHSLKDLPTTLPPKLCIAAILERECPDDALVLKSSLKLDKPFTLIQPPSDNKSEWVTKHNIKEPIVIGTSSLRRIAQLRFYNPEVEPIDIRGNLTTRMNKLDDPDGPYSALILAYAGLKRSGYEDRISHQLDSDWWYAVGQGALAIECREDDLETIRFLSPLIHCKTTFEVIAERVFMAKLEGGCSVPLGVRCSWDPTDIVNEDFGDEKRRIKLTLHGSVFSLDGTKSIKTHEEADLADEIDIDDVIGETKHFTSICLPPSNAPCYSTVRRNFINSAKIGLKLAEKFRKLGAMAILEEIRKFKSPTDKDD